MSLDSDLVDTIKAHFAGKPTGELREIVASNDLVRWSPEAIEAARLLIEAEISDCPLKPNPTPLQTSGRGVVVSGDESVLALKKAFLDGEIDAMTYERLRAGIDATRIHPVLQPAIREKPQNLPRSVGAVKQAPPPLHIDDALNVNSEWQIRSEQDKFLRYLIDEVHQMRPMRVLMEIFWGLPFALLLFGGIAAFIAVFALAFVADNIGIVSGSRLINVLHTLWSPGNLREWLVALGPLTIITGMVLAAFAKEADKLIRRTRLLSSHWKTETVSEMMKLDEAQEDRIRAVIRREGLLQQLLGPRYVLYAAIFGTAVAYVYSVSTHLAERNPWTFAHFGINCILVFLFTVGAAAALLQEARREWRRFHPSQDR